MDSDLSIKKARRIVHCGDLSNDKRAMRRRNRRAEKVRLATMGCDYTPAKRRLTSWDIA